MKLEPIQRIFLLKNSEKENLNWLFAILFDQVGHHFIPNGCVGCLNGYCQLKLTLKETK